jgi:hypothetical protein
MLIEKYKKNNWIKIGIINDKPAIELNTDTLEDWINNDLFFVNVYRSARNLGSNVAFVMLGDPDNQDTVVEKLLSIQNKVIVGDVVVEFIKSYHIKPIIQEEKLSEVVVSVSKVIKRKKK